MKLVRFPACYAVGLVGLAFGIAACGGDGGGATASDAGASDATDFDGATSADGGPGDDASADGGSASDAAAPDATPTDGSSTDASLPTFTVTFDPITVSPGAEQTQCVVKRVGNTASVHIGAIHDVIQNAPGATMLVYAVPDTVEQPTPFACTPFSLLANGNGTAIAVSRAADDTFDYPSGIAATLAANQLVRIELHYTNSTSNSVQIGASSTMTAVPDSSFQQEAGLLFLTDPDISIPAASTFTLGPVYYPLNQALGATPQVFAASGIENRLGTGMSAAVTTGKTGTDTPIYGPSSFAWDNPTTTMISPAIAVPSGGGFHATCTWNNTTSTTVAFGAPMSDELCMNVVHYAPSQGSFLCIHTDKTPGGLDVCCPGNPVCSQLFP